MLKRNTVFLAHCFEHPCRVSSRDGRISGVASLVTISPDAARIHLTNGLRGSLAVGQDVILRPLFPLDPDLSVSGRIRDHENDCLHLLFDRTLPMTSFDLVRLARKS